MGHAGTIIRRTVGHDRLRELVLELLDGVCEPGGVHAALLVPDPRLAVPQSEVVRVEVQLETAERDLEGAPVAQQRVRRSTL